MFTIATFNVENLMRRFDFSGFRNELHQDRTLQLFEINDEAQYRLLEQARAVAHADDTRQMTALAIAETRADILCLQEVDNLAALNAFEYGYLFKMIGHGFRHKYLIDGNDSRGIDVAVMMRDTTRDGQPIEVDEVTSYAYVTYNDFGFYEPVLGELGLEPHDRIFKRDCLNLDIRIAGKLISLFVTHLKSMTGARNGFDGRTASLPVRRAEARAMRRIIEDKFGPSNVADRRWLICGDFNDYRERIIIGGDEWNGYQFTPMVEEESALDVLLADGFAVNLVERRPVMDRWTLYHTRGPRERHLCQLDYIMASPSFAKKNEKAVPNIIRRGQPWRTIFPPDQQIERYPRTGWDRPKASDHCPVAVTLNMV